MSSFKRRRLSKSSSVNFRPVSNTSKLSQRLVGHGANVNRTGSAKRLIAKPIG